MNGLCGWVGHRGREGALRELLEQMARSMRPGERDASNRLVGDAVALAASRTFRDHGLMVGLVGQPRFDDPGLVAEAGARGIPAALGRGYRERGSGVFRLLRGAFAVAVIDEQAGEAVLAVDRIGGRFPLAYRHAGDGLVFASSTAALRVHPQGSAQTDPQGIYNYLYFNVVPGPGTTLRGVQRLMPGCLLRFAGGNGHIERYWEMEYVEDGRASADDLAAELRDVVRKSVQSDATSERPVGCFLSGGTDSSTIAGLLADLRPESARSYSIGFDAQGYDEMRYARIAVERFGTAHRDYYVTPQDVVETIPRVARAYGQPFGNSSAVPTYHCARLARADGIERMLAGDGGDELFAGNERYMVQRIFEMYFRVPGVARSLFEPLLFTVPGGDRLPPVRKARSYVRKAKLPLPGRLQTYNHLELAGPATVLEPEFLSRVDTGQPLALLEETYHGARAGCALNRMLALDLRFTLADNDLPKVSRMCEAAGVDVVYPLLSDEVVDLARRVPPRLQMRRWQLRWFWKYAWRELLPREILNKSKKGFGLPFGVWLRDHPGLNELTRESLRSLKSRGIVRPDYIDDLVHRHRTVHAVFYGVMIWVLLMLEQWFQNHVDASAYQQTP